MAQHNVCSRCHSKLSTGKEEMLDSCAKCGAVLCEVCMQDGCCDVSPALSARKENIEVEQLASWQDLAKLCVPLQIAA